METETVMVEFSGEELDMILEYQEASSLCNGIDREILELKHFMERIDEKTFSRDLDITSEIIGRIFYANEGLKKLAGVLSFIDCWEENGEPPQLSYRASFMGKEGSEK